MIKTTKSTELPVRIVTMVTDIWIQVFVVQLPDVPVIHDDIQCKRLEGSIGRFTSLKELQMHLSKFKYFQVSRAIGRISMI